MQLSRIQIHRCLWLATLVSVAFAVFALPQTVRAHGELLIRIAAATRQIEVATNNCADLYLQRGEFYREDRNWKAAEADYGRAERLDPKLVAVEVCRAKMLVDSSQLEAAHAMFDKAIARDPINGEAFIGRARVLTKLEQRKAAISDFKRGLELLPAPQPEYFVELSQNLVGEEKQDEALQTLDVGIKKFGPMVKLQHYALDLELRQKDYDAALARLDTIIHQAERQENWLAQRGDILLAAGRTADARKSYTAALAAVKTLPSRLQQGQAMRNLQSRVSTALENLPKPEATAK